MLILRVGQADSADGALPEIPDSRGPERCSVESKGGSEGDESEGRGRELALTESQDHRDIFDLLVRDLIAAAELTATARGRV